jgi:hypothetical protein
MDTPEVWVAKDDGTEILRATEIAAVSLDYNGAVTARLAGGEVAVVTLVSGRPHEDEHRPADFHRELLHAVTQLADSSGAHLLRPVHDEEHGWRWVSEPL